MFAASFAAKIASQIPSIHESQTENLTFSFGSKVFPFSPFFSHSGDEITNKHERNIGYGYFERIDFFTNCTEKIPPVETTLWKYVQLPWSSYHNNHHHHRYHSHHSSPPPPSLPQQDLAQKCPVFFLSSTILSSYDFVQSENVQFIEFSVQKCPVLFCPVQKCPV